MKAVNTKKYVLLSILAVSILVVFLLPKITEAAQIYQVLDPNYDSSVGDTVRDVWQKLLYAVNGLIIVVLIFIAFANILRININTYGIKKFLPTLIFAVIAANFSYLFCRVLIDFANAIMHLLAYGGGGINSTELTGVSTAFKFPADEMSKITNGGSTADWGELGKVLIYTLLEVVGAILIFILGALFFVRNYVIYFLVALSPLAFMSMVLPQTKNLFNQWFDNFWKWAFLPAISLFWLWVGGMWYAAGFDNSGWQMLGLVFSGVCYYLAITTPFKIGSALAGGGVFNWQKTAGKKAWGATGGKAVDYQRAKSQAAWQARWNNVQNAIKMRTGWGKGLDYTQQKLADSEKRRAGLQDKFRGEYVEKRGKERALWEVQNMALEGNVEYASAQALNAALGNERLAKKIRAMREKSQRGMADMAIWEANWKSSEEELKERLFKYKDREGNEIGRLVDGKWQAVAGREKEFNERRKFIDAYGSSLWNATLREAEATKASGDTIEDAVKDRQQYDNVQTQLEEMEDMNSSLEELIRLQKIEKRSAEEEEKFRMLQAKYRARGYDVSDIHSEREEREIRERIKGDLGLAQENKKIALEEVRKKIRANGDQMPSHLIDMIDVDQNGNVTDIIKRSALEKSRMGKWLSQEVLSPGIMTVNEQWSGLEQISTLMHGNSSEGLNAEAMKNYFSGLRTKNNAGTNEKIQRFVRAAGSKLGNKNNPESEAALTGMVDILLHHQNDQGLQEIARVANRNNPSLGLDTTLSREDLRDAIVSKAREGGESGEKNWKAISSAILASKALGLAGRGPDNF